MNRSRLTRNIVIGMVSGLMFGYFLHWIGAEEGFVSTYLVNGVFDFGGKIFIASLKLLVVPLVFFSLACGASNLSDGSSMGRIGLKTLALYLLTTAIAITLALSIATTINPGLGIDLVTTAQYVAKESPPLKQVLIDIFPTNPLRAMADGNMLQVIVFAILIGVAISRCGDPGARVRAALNDWNEVVMRLVMMLMVVAPAGVFCLMVTLFANMGLGAIADLIKYFMTVVLVLLVHFSLTYGVLVRFLAGLNPFTFYKRFAPVMAYAFSTSSSNATLPVTLETVEHRLGVKNEVASFTVPLGQLSTWTARRLCRVLLLCLSPKPTTLTFR